MVYTRFKDGYAREGASTYGTSAIPDTNTETYLFGVISKRAVHPSPVATLGERAPAVNEQEVIEENIWKEFFELAGMYPVGMQNGILLQAVMGKSSTTGTDPYVHTITPPTAVSGVLPPLPSFTIQHEMTGTSDDWAIQFTGVKIASLMLTCGFDQRYLISKVDWIARKAEEVAFTLTNSPVLPATANTTPYHFNNMSLTYNSVEIDGITDVELLISPDLSIDRAHTWEGSTYTGQWLRSLIESPKKIYNLKISYHPPDSNLWNELVASTNNKDVVITWTRSANDYIQATLTGCKLTGHTITTPEVSESLIEQVEMRPSQVSFEVKDSIAGGHYGG